jgi:capsular exopolysaccharide synthesis family protein
MQDKTFNLYNNSNKAVINAYEMLTANIHICNSQKELRTFVFTSCNPKEGKTSLAISLAITMANSGWKVLLVDADLRKPSTAKRLNIGSIFGLSDYLKGDLGISDIVYKTNLANLYYIACGYNNTNPIELLCSVRFEELINEARREYDFVLFDTPALASVLDGALVASKVDAALLVVKMGLTTLTSLKRIKEHLENLNVKILGVILNNVKKRDYKLYFESYNYFFGSRRNLINKKTKMNKLPTDMDDFTFSNPVEVKNNYPL